MTDPRDLNADGWFAQLATARRDSPTNDRTVARVHAEAAVSQAVSLSVIANALHDLTRALWPAEGEPTPDLGGGSPEAPTDYRKLVVGDVVTDEVEEYHVDEVGYSEGEQWVILIDGEGETQGRVWSRGLIFARHDGAESSAPEYSGPQDAAEAADPDESFDVDVDFEEASAPDEAAEAAKADAFTAARKATGKGKKGGK